MYYYFSIFHYKLTFKVANAASVLNTTASTAAKFMPSFISAQVMPTSMHGANTSTHSRYIPSFIAYKKHNMTPLTIICHAKQNGHTCAYMTYNPIINALYIHLYIFFI